MMDAKHLEHPVENAGGMPDESINISDVIEVIATDPDFKESTMFNGGGEIPQTAIPQQQVHQSRRRAQVKIVEQPASKALRFRYECEGRSAGSIPGASSTPENKTFPSIQVVGYKGRAVVVVSCVTKDEPYRPHPHNLVGREGCKKGVCTMEISPDTMCVTFSNLGIQCVKKKDIENALRVREEIKVDPFMTGFSHRNQPTSIDLNAVRLCFQVFLEGERRGKFTVPLTPVVSEPIYDKKAMSDLLIVKLSHCVSYVDGGRNEIILLCEKVAKEDIQVRFFEEKDGRVVWEGYGDFQPSQVHKQTAICFKAPRYHTLDITEPVKVFVQLKRPSDGATSEPLPFELLPLDSEPGMLKRKRQKYHDPNHLLRHIEDSDKHRTNQPYLLNIPMEGIKVEPKDKAPSPYGGQMFETLSPAQNVSPHYVGASPPPPNFTQNVLPSIDMIHWNMPSTSVGNVLNIQQEWNVAAPNDLSGVVNIESVSGISSLLNLDSHQMELKPIDLNSGDLSMFDASNLSETFTQNLSLTDLNGVRQDQNMTDSLTRLANNALDNICRSNDIYKGPAQ
ncbi:embryonic polarity protein dorsal-like isoform X3 [Tenebrio molitor]|uniref:embryonic polarity protein dorsal-like isoform X3 n=1 Tax=Tenebrio molitor TaxID=7067 RepID=UPI0036247228